MGQKVHPYGFRVGVTKPWRSRWYNNRRYADYLHEDVAIRSLVRNKLKGSGVSRVEIERAASKVRVIVCTAKPGLVIGKKGVGIDSLKLELQVLTQSDLFLDVQEVKRPEHDAQLVSESVALQLERRVAFRRALKKAVQSSLKAGVLGIKVQVAGRLGGAEMARTEWYREGRVPLHTLRADIDFGFTEAMTAYGVIGVKVWIYRGDVLN